MLLFKEFTFDSAHFLPNVPDGHKCKAMHGHTYRLRVYIKGKPDVKLGWVLDFAEIKKVIDPVVKLIDHQTLNDIAGLENPTCEILAMWLWKKSNPRLPVLKRIELHETPASAWCMKANSRGTSAKKYYSDSTEISKLSDRHHF